MKERMPHQKKLVDETWHLPAYAVDWEMRVRKTIPMLDTAKLLREQRLIDAVIVLGPGGVPINWVKKAIPEVQTEDDLVVAWEASKARSVRFQRLLDDAFFSPRMVWLCANYEAVATPTLNDFLSRFIGHRKCLVILDEAHKVKNPKALVTRTLAKLTKFCPYRRKLTGTPVPKSPFDLWSQYYLLDPTILGSSFTVFKQRYGIWKSVRYGAGPVHLELDKSQGQNGYRNLEELQAKIAPITSRLTQREVYKDLPPITPEVRYFELSAQQRKVYNTLRDELVASLGSGLEITATQAMTNVLRLQQISRGFVAGAVHTETGEKQTVEIDGPNPAVESLVDFLEDTPGKVIVWCRFKDDVYKIHRALTVAEIKHVLYTGDHKVQVRAELIDQFNNDPETKALIGIPGAGGIGVNMAAADTTAFYSHGYNWAERAQAIARMQDLDKPNPLLLVDFVAADTVDERCLELTTEKEDLAAVLTGDRLRAML